MRKKIVGKRVPQKNVKPKLSLRDEIFNLGNQLKQIANDNGCKSLIQPIMRKKKVASDKKTILIETVLLTSQVVVPNLAPLQQWLGLQKLTGIEQESESLSYQVFDFQFNTYHYVDRPVRLVEDVKPDIKVIAYDEEFVLQHNLEIYLKELTIQTPCCFLISLQQEDPNLAINRLKLFSNCLHVEAFHLSDLRGNGFLEKVTKKEFLTKIKLIELYNQVNDYSVVGKILSQNLQTKKQLIANNNLLNKKELIKYRHRETEISAKDINVLRNDLGKSFKNIARIIDDQANQYDMANNDSYLTNLKNKIEQTDKFQEEKGIKSILFKIPQGVIKELHEGIYTKIKTDFDKSITAIKTQINNIETEVRGSFRDLGVNSPVLVSKPLSSQLSEEVLNQGLRFDRPYEKQITKKGMSNLMMEIRTPLFMIMPLMMFVGIFASFFQSNDSGVSRVATEKYGRRAVLIESLPEKYKEIGFAVFAKDIVFKRSVSGFSRKNKTAIHPTLQDKETKKSMLSMKVKKVSIKKGFGKSKMEIHYKPEFKILPEEKGLVLFCEANPDEVKDILDNCENSLLCIPGAASQFSIYKIGGLVAQLGSYRYIAIVLIFGLVTMFVRSKRKEFADEKIEIRDREKKNLKQALKQDVEKMIRNSTNRWRSKMQDYVKEQEITLQFAVDNSLNKVIDTNKEKVQEQMGIIERRMKHFKEQENNVMATQKILNAHLKKIQSLKFKFRELMNLV